MNCFWINISEMDIPKLCKASKGVAVLPLGSMESHGPHLPLGSDSICINELVKRVVCKETVAVLPTLNYTYVVEAQSLPGAVHLPSQLMLEQMECICDEAWRNGFDKIVFLHAHGGNGAHTQVFSQRMVEKAKPYAVYNFGCFGGDLAGVKAVVESELWGHACEAETSILMAIDPELVHLERVKKGRPFPALKGPDVGLAQSPAWWIAAYPEMVCGNPLPATAEKGEKILELWENHAIDAIRKIKKDTVTLSSIRKHIPERAAVRARVKQR